MKKSVSIGIAVLIIIIAAVIIMATMPKKHDTHTSTTTTTESMGPVIKTVTSSSLGSYLTDGQGRPLYTYNADQSDVSNCSGNCLGSWPAYQSVGVTNGLPTNVGTIKRSDNGETQYTYKMMPLYYFAGDSGVQPTGNGVGNFKLAQP